VRWIVLASGLAMFAAVSLAVRYHFKSSRRSWRFLGLSVATAVNAFVFARELWLRAKPEPQLGMALALFVVSGVLFAASLRASRAGRLKLIFEADMPVEVLASGPYRYIRHPFYASYILFWSGCAIATLHPLNIAYALGLIPLLAMAAWAEEAGFAASAQAEAYRHYRRRAGLFWPKLPG